MHLKTKLKLKMKFKVGIVLLVVLIVGAIYGKKQYDIYLYEETLEYQFLSIGYTNEEIDILLNTLNDDYIDKLLEKNYDEDLFSLLEETYYIEDNLYDYLEFIETNDIEVSEVITIINTGLDSEYYENVYIADTSLNELMLVNKYSYLSNYTPSDLVSVSSNYSWGEYGSQKLVSSVYDAFVEMAIACKNETDITLMVSSSYRTNEYQEELYNEQKDAYGVYYADTVAARAGYSEHETGYAMDILSLEWTTKTDFDTSLTFAWLVENAHSYGFILRYPEDKEDITGFTYEPWHYRYVGKDVAEYIYENDITFDEYYAYFIA